jgi:alkane 1-monooxygenase
MWRDWKYLIAYVAPLAAFWGVYAGGAWSPGSLYIGFVLIPLLEQFLPKSTVNVSAAEEPARSSRRVFDVLLYLNIPLLYGLLAYFFYTLLTRELSTSEYVWMTLNVGLMVGIIGINVAHELGHRTNPIDQRLSQFLLLSALYMHFFIEHNRGHHKHVATEADPATSRQGETLYAFWLRSALFGYLNAWKLEAERLRKAGLSFWHPSNQMLQFQLIQAAYVLGLGLWLGWMVAGFAVAAAVVGFLLLESVNYIEHYGLLRERLPSGRYEPVQPWHSWNSDHELGRIFLYELTRHSDHHYKATRKYQVLRHFDESPQLRLGYPASILLALLPPLWFRVMNPLLPGLRSSQRTSSAM